MAKKELVYRSATFERSAINEETRTVEVAFSSETPVERWDGMEVLGHRAGEVNLNFLNSGTAPLLLDHNRTQHIGVVESVRVEDGVGRATVRFGKNGLAAEIFDDVVDGIRANISVGYLVRGQEQVEKKNGTVTYRVTNWQPKEISIVSIPADSSVGVGRSDDEQKQEEEITMTQETRTESVTSAPEVNVEAIRSETRAEANKSAADRVRKIQEFCTRQGLESEIADFINSDKSFDEVREIGLDLVEKRQAAIKPAGNIELSKAEEQRYSLVNAIRAVATRDWTDAGFEREISQEIATRMGRTAAGIFVPTSLLNQRAMLASGTNVGEDFIATEQGQYIPPIFENSVLANIGVSFLPGLVGNVEMPKEGAATAFDLADDDTAITESTPASDKVTLSPNGVGALVSYSAQMLAQATPAVDARVRDNIRNTVLQHVQRKVITSILGTSGIGAASSLGTDGGAPTWAMLNELVKEVAVDNLMGNAFLTNPKVMYALRTTAKVASTDSRMLLEGDNILGYNTGVTNAVASNLTKGSGTGLSALIFGDFSKVVVGDWGAMEIAASDSHGSNFAKGHTAVRALYYMDTAVTYPEAIAASKEIVTG